MPGELRRASLREARASYDPTILGEAVGQLLRKPPAVDTRHITVPRVSLAERLAKLRELLRGGSFKFEEAVEGADRVTVAITLFAALELYKQGELTWSQDEPFGEIEISATRQGAELGPAGSAPRRPTAGLTA